MTMVGEGYVTALLPMVLVATLRRRDTRWPTSHGAIRSAAKTVPHSGMPLLTTNSGRGATERSSASGEEYRDGSLIERLPFVAHP